MDDLIGGLLVITVAAVIIAALIAIALAMVAISAVVGSGVVGVGGLGTFLSSLWQRVSTRGAADRRPRPPEPAYELYVLGQLGRDLRAAGDDAWASMQLARQVAGQFASAHSDGVTMPLGVGAVVGGLLGTALGGLIGAILALPVVIVSVVAIAGSWALIGVLRLAEAVRRKVRHTSYECPVDHERFALPVYVCPFCGAEHHRLVPGRWGIIKRECECGQVALPTMVLNGRQRVPQTCPSGHPMAGIIGYAEMLRFALVAGPRAGKSTFLAAALHELEEVSDTGTLALGVVNQSRSDFDTALDNFRRGRLPPKTQAGRNPALVAEIQGGGRTRVLSLYDVGGESYVADDAIRELRFLEVPSGLVLLVDPLALERVANEYEDEIAGAEEQLRPSPVPPIRVLERMLEALEAAGAKRDKLPVAVVVGKTDALNLGDEIARLQQTAGDRAVPIWLEHQGGGNFVRAVESAFNKVGWFSATALGRVPDASDRSAFAPSGTAAPLLWLLRQKGVVPAATRFSPAQAAERLSGASAQDFPPIGRAGWAFRAAPAAALSLALLGLIGLGAVAAVKQIPVSGAGPSLAAEPAAHVNPTTTHHRGAFTLALTRAWRSGAKNVRHRGYVESRWHPNYDPAAMILVDYTRRVRQTAPASARLVRRQVSRAPSYVEYDWRPVTLKGRRAWRWEFRLNRRHKVDYFVNACGTGYALLGSSTPGTWSRFEPKFDLAARSLRPTC